MDLGAAASKVQKKDKPHAAPPGGFSLVLFAALDKDSAKKAVDAVSKLKGVDKKETKADEKKGEVVVRIAGGEKLTVAALVDALSSPRSARRIALTCAVAGSGYSLTSGPA